MFAKAYGKAVYDTPSFNFKNMPALQEECEMIVKMGFDGKLAIHPAQVEVINQAFNMIDIDYLKLVVKSFEESGKGVFEFDGKIYEAPHINHIKKIIKEKVN